MSSGCQWAAGYEDFEPPQGEEPAPCEVLEKTKSGPRDQTMVRVDIQGDGCFWIDQTEVTVAEYNEWLDTNKDFDGWDTYRCPWKPAGPSDPAGNPDDECRSTIADNEIDPFGSSKPIRCVDWCDAEAFCRKNAAHLCYDYNSGAFLEPENQTAEWRLACTNSDTTSFPWGDLPNKADGLCNISQDPDATGGCLQKGGATSCGPSRAGVWDECRTRSGIDDMLGNVAEWVFSCQKTNEANLPDKTCRVFGGSYASTSGKAKCALVSESLDKIDRRPDVGFRCCSDLTSREKKEAGLL